LHTGDEIDELEFPMIPIDEQERASAWLERAWLARYLDRELSEDETARFEAYVLDKPELLAQIDADTALRDTLAAVAQAADAPGTQDAESGDPSEQPAVAPDPGPAASGPSVLRPQPRRGLPSWLALAASLLVGLGVGALLRGAPGEGAGSVRVSPARVVFDTMRGAAQQPRWEDGGPGASDVIVDIAVAPDAQTIVLKLSDGKELNLAASGEGFATFVAPWKMLAGKKAELSVVTKDGRIFARTLEFKERD
jgi:anti-sigma factor RsiW